MNRILIERSGLAGLLLAASLLLAPPAGAQSDTERARARVHFDQGVAFAKASAYEAALAEFERAYELVPHYGVLYNIAQAQLALGRTAEARASFERYLSDGGGAITAARRAEVEAQLARLPAPPNATSAPAREFPPEPAHSPQTEPAPARTLPATPAAVPARAPASPAPSPAPVATPAPAQALTQPAQPIETERAAPSAKRALGYVLGGASVALAGAAMGHYLWNRGRYRDWQSIEAAYEQNPSEAERSNVNELGQSIRRASIVTVALSIGASLTLGTGVVLFVSARPTSQAQRGDLFPSTFGVRGNF
jgi:tetratricopeptide (TPR) repeat protein